MNKKRPGFETKHDILTADNEYLNEFVFANSLAKQLKEQKNTT